MATDGQEGAVPWITCRAVFMMEEDHSIPVDGKPLMLEAILAVQFMERAANSAWRMAFSGFLLSARPALSRRQLPASRRERTLVISEQHAQLLNFLDNDENTLVLCRAALPIAQAGPGFAYAAPGHELRRYGRTR